MGIEFKRNRFVNLFKEPQHAILGKKVIPFGGVIPVTPTPSPSFAGYYYEIQECVGPNYGWILSPTPLALGSGLKISGSSECWEVFAQSGPEPTLLTVTDYYDNCADCQASIPTPTPTQTPTTTPTPTPTYTGCETCGEWEVEHGGGIDDPDFTFSYVDCYSKITYTGSVSPGNIATLTCICDGSVDVIFGEPSVSRLGVCATPTPTPSITPTITPTTGPCQLVLDYPTISAWTGTYNKLDEAGILDFDGTDTLLCSGSTTLWYRNDDSDGFNRNRFIARTIYDGNDYEFRLVTVIDSETTINCGYSLSGLPVSFGARLQQNGYYGGLLYPLEGDALNDTSGNEYSLTYQDCPTPTPTPTQTQTPTNSSTPTPTPSITPSSSPLSCESCFLYDIENTGEFPLDYSYVNCDNLTRVYSTLPSGSFAQVCACEGTVVIEFGTGVITEGLAC